MTTSKHLQQSDWLETELKSMSSAEDFPAKTSALLAGELAWPESVPASGLNTQDLLASFDPNTSSWRTSQHCLVEGLAPYSETWPRSGMTRNGTAYRLPVLVCPTLGTESGLLPTICKSEGKGTSAKRFKGSTEYRGAKMSEGLRNGLTDMAYTHPDLACAAMGFPKHWAHMEMP